MLLAGVDEAGRGPLAGPVFAAAVILADERPIAGLTDSKLLSPARRDEIARQIRDSALAWAVASASVAEIDTMNILRATLLAMQRAVAALGMSPHEVWVDGLHCPSVACTVRAIVRGDLTVGAISAASILAKVSRDALLVELDQVYPGYGFAQHKGYGTREHLAALHHLGPCPIHRRSFAPVAQMELGLALGRPVSSDPA